MEQLRKGFSNRPRPVSADRRPRFEIRCSFRSRFDSSKARKTVRWGCFRGLLFAPVFVVKQGPQPIACKAFEAVRCMRGSYHFGIGTDAAARAKGG